MFTTMHDAVLLILAGYMISLALADLFTFGKGITKQAMYAAPLSIATCLLMTAAVW